MLQRSNSGARAGAGAAAPKRRSLFLRTPIVIDPENPADAIFTDAAHDLDLAAAREAFTRLVALEAAYDPALAECYADDGVVIENTEEKGARKRTREMPIRRYKAQLKEALAASRQARIASSHSEIRIERLGPGWAVVRSLRACTQSRAPAPHEVTFRRDGDGVWRVVKEVATLVR